MHVQNVHTMDELKMTGNCLKGCRGLVSFDRAFDETEWGKLTKEVFTQVHLIFSWIGMIRLTLFFLWTDFWRAFDVKEGKALHRSYFDILHCRFEDLVP